MQTKKSQDKKNYFPKILIFFQKEEKTKTMAAFQNLNIIFSWSNDSHFD